MLAMLIVAVQTLNTMAALPIKKKSIATLRQELSPKYKEWLESADINEEDVSFSLINLENLKTEDTFNEELAFIPASLTKAFTGYFVLSQLGANYTYKTSLYYDGKIEDGTLKGNLYLHGEGDPILTHARLFNLVLSLRSHGIKKIEGKFIYDDSFLKNIQIISRIGLGDQTYNPGISSLSSEFNRFSVWRDTKPTEVFTTIPTLDTLLISKTSEFFDPGREFKFIDPTFISSLKGLKSKVVYGSNNKIENVEHWVLTDSLKYRTLQDIPIRRPSLFTASTFRFMAKKIGINLPFPEKGIKTKGSKILGQESSPKLHEIVKLTLEYSNNLMAELMMLTAVKKLTGKKHSLEKSASIMQQWLKTKFPTIKWDKIYLINGSGLTSANTVTAHEFSQFFAKTRDKSFDGKFFWSLLGVAGKSGFLKRRFPTPDYSYNIWAKTGSIDYVNNIAGYLFSQSGKSYAFSILINDLNKRKVVDGDNSEIVNKFRKKASLWKRKNNSFHKDLLLHWIKNY